MDLRSGQSQVSERKFWIYCRHATPWAEQQASSASVELLLGGDVAKVGGLHDGLEQQARPPQQAVLRSIFRKASLPCCRILSNHVVHGQARRKKKIRKRGSVLYLYLYICTRRSSSTSPCPVQSPWLIRNPRSPTSLVQCPSSQNPQHNSIILCLASLHLRPYIL